MDVLEMKEDAAWRESAQRKKEEIENWNKTTPIGTLVCGPYSRPKSYDDGNGEWVSEVAYGRTTSAAYLYHHLHVVVDIEGNTRVPINNFFEPDGSSPALAKPCPVCGAPVGRYCRRDGRHEPNNDDGKLPWDFGGRNLDSVQVIAHKRRRAP